MFDPTQIIRGIRLTEKATLLGEQQNQYVFHVDMKATKADVKTAVEVLFEKSVTSVNVCHYFGKARRKRTAAAGRTAHWKKAFVTLAPGQKLDLA